MHRSALIAHRVVIECLFEGVEAKLCVQRVRDAPAHDTPRIGIDDKGNVDEAAPGRHIGRLRHPQRIRLASLEHPVHPVRGSCELVRPHRAGISNGHLYNLRRSLSYRRRRTTLTHTRSTPVAIGERRRPCPAGCPGYIRMDTVHQGDHDGYKGVYHVNVVDEVPQLQHVGTVEAISEHFPRARA